MEAPKVNKFDVLKFPVHTIEKDEDPKIMSAYQALFKYPEFSEYNEPNRTKLIKYFSYLYDPNSPLYEDHADLQERKEAAAIEAGWLRNSKEEFSKDVQDLFKLIKPVYVGMAVRFIRIFNNTKWTEICTLEQEIQSLTTARWKSLNDPKKLVNSDKLMAMAQNRIENLERMLKDFFSDNNDLKEKAIELEMITPENAQRIMFVNVQSS